jgi:acyl transferase domain-containing protein
MPNIPANRLNVQFDWRAFGFTVSGEELSGLDALRVAARALRHGEIDAALVGAVDLSAEPVHEAAAAAVLPADRQRSGDAAVALVLKRLDDARRQGAPVYAVHGRDDTSAPFVLSL